MSNGTDYKLENNCPCCNRELAINVNVYGGRPNIISIARKLEGQNVQEAK